jgi:fluoride exporter
LLPEISLLSGLAIAAGAVPGALSRYYLTAFCKRILGTSFPYGTFIVNFTGCLLMGFFFTLFKGIKGFPHDLDLLVRAGFLGSYTTFSTYGYDTLMLWRDHKPEATLVYWVGSAVLGLIGIAVGHALAQPIVG